LSQKEEIEIRKRRKKKEDY